jgi:hypothetical protein
MPTVPVLILAVAQTSGGVCVAGMTTEPHPITGLRWVRPVREHSSPGMDELATRDRRTLRPFAVAEFSLLRPRPIPPHTEDWIADFEHDPPRVLRHLEGEQRTRFLNKYRDRAPRQVLESQQRSLCLVKASSVTGSFRRDSGSAHLDARLVFRLEGRTYRDSITKGGLVTTDLQWLTLGNSWLPEDGGWTEFDASMLEARFGIQEIYLVVALSRLHQRRFKPTIVGVHTVPDYQAPGSIGTGG